ncbi:MAG: PAS domain-containing sensor histidine kinase [Gemmatimonadaceae bacterium]|nr:PAS domain-containing sensor histidine kinase [Gemmatimonadaceae bacterium]
MTDTYRSAARERAAPSVEKLEQELRAADARFEGIVGIAADAIISVDEAQTIILFNEGAEQIFGYAAAEAIGRPLDMLLPEPYRASHRVHVRDFGAGQDRARRMDHRRSIAGLRKNGEEFPAEASISKYTVAGSVVYNVVLRDVSEQRRAADLLQALYDEAKQAVLARDQTIAVVSHDLRNPVNAIKMLAAALVRSARNDAERNGGDQVYDSAEIIRRAAEQADRLIQDLLDVSHIEAGSLRIHVAPEDLEEIIEAATEFLSPFAKDKSVELRREPSAELPLVKVDASRIHQVISNIAGNAIKFTPPGGSVTISVEREPAELVVAVSDTGPGLPREQMDNLADRRWQAKRQTSGGSGLGLVIAKGIIEAHGGRLWAAARPEGGSVFRFSLPIYEVAPA